MGKAIRNFKSPRNRETFDPRGGWNRYSFQVDFFKRWSNEMAYVLGFLYADGNITDAATSSRTQYIKFSNNEKEILEKIKSVLKAEHPIHSRPPHTSVDKYGHLYRSSESFHLRVGSKRMFADLIKLGLILNKSKVMKFPFVPPKYLGHFLRGYFDGDGTIYLEQRKGIKQKLIFKRAKTVFSSGSKTFLKGLSNILAAVLNARKAKVYKGDKDFQIVYSTKESVKIFKFMYKDPHDLFLERKFDNFKKFFNTRTKWLDKEVAKILHENEEHSAA